MRKLIPFTLLLIVLVTVSAAAAQDPFEVFVYVDRDTLTLYVPASGVISLEGIGFQVQVNDTARTVDLADYPAFGLPFDQLPTPICFRLRSSGSRTPLPQACSSAITLTQDLAAADVFWYDAVAETSRVILVTQNGTPFTICPSGASECTGEFTPPEVTSTPAPTETPERSFEPETYTDPDERFSFAYPEGWVLDHKGFAAYGEGEYFYLGSTEDGFAALQDPSLVTSGEQVIAVMIGDVRAITGDSLTTATFERLTTFFTGVQEETGIRVLGVETFTVGDYAAARIDLSSSQDDFDGAIYLLEFEENTSYATLLAVTAPGELDALIPVMDQIAASIEVSLPDETSESPGS